MCCYGMLGRGEVGALFLLRVIVLLPNQCFYVFNVTLLMLHTSMLLY